MEFGKKIKNLRMQKNITQEQLAERLFVSRVTVSKWERDRGYPNIDSVKLMAEVFSVSIDDLLSCEKTVLPAENQQKTASGKRQSFLSGIIDVLAVLFLLLPFYSNYYTTHVDSVVLSKLANVNRDIIAAHYIIVILTIILGIGELVLQNYQNKIWILIKNPLSLCITTGAIFLSIVTRQLYAGLLFLLFLLIKCFFCIKIK